MFIAGRHVFFFHPHAITYSLSIALKMSSSIYEIFHYLPPSVHQCPANVTSTASPNLVVPLQTTVPFLPCQFHNMTDNYTNRVQLVDNNYLMRAPTHFDCYVLLFFARWCQFSVRFAPYFNAVPRAFPGLDFVAYDVSKSLRYMTYFGTNAVPSVFILRKNKLLARLNSTNDIHILLNLIETTLRKQKFVGRGNETDCCLDLDLNQTVNVTVQDEDRRGPVTTEFEAAFDYALLFSWLFVGLFLYYYADKYHLLPRTSQ